MLRAGYVQELRRCVLAPAFHLNACIGMPMSAWLAVLSVQSPTHCRGKATDLRWGIYCMDECKAMSAALLEKLDCALTHDS